MAASANPSGNQEGSNHGVNPPTNNGNSVAEHSVQTQAALRHNPGLSVEWTADEQSILEELLVKYASESSVSRYAKIAMQLEDKTVRDVALRCRWMTKKENGKRRKEDHNLARRNKDKKLEDPPAASSSASEEETEGVSEDESESSSPLLSSNNCNKPLLLKVFNKSSRGSDLEVLIGPPTGKAVEDSNINIEDERVFRNFSIDSEQYLVF